MRAVRSLRLATFEYQRLLEGQRSGNLNNTPPGPTDQRIDGSMHQRISDLYMVALPKYVERIGVGFITVQVDYLVDFDLQPAKRKFFRRRFELVALHERPHLLHAQQ